MPEVTDSEATDRAKLLETEIERRLAERFAALRDEFDRLRMETDRRWFGFLEKFNQDLKGVVPAELVASAAPRAAGASRAGAVSIETARGLDLAATQVDVLHRFLDECRKHCSRAALLVARGGSIGAWKAVGFSAHGGDDDAVRQLALPLTDGGLLSRLMTGTALRLPAANEISTLLRAARVSEAVAIPMVVREKISGALYADAVLGEEQSLRSRRARSADVSRGSRRRSSRGAQAETGARAAAPRGGQESGARRNVDERGRGRRGSARGRGGRRGARRPSPDARGAARRRPVPPSTSRRGPR